MKKTYVLNIILFLFLSISTNSYACSCECRGDCTFSKISKDNDFVALVKVIEYSDYLNWETESGKKMPYSVTVEVIKKYKGSEKRKRIKIWGDNGMLCRPYINELKIGKYYLIAPNLIDENSKTGNAGDYDFFVCNVDYLQVDFRKKIAVGEYSKWKNEISLKDFENRMKK